MVRVLTVRLRPVVRRADVRFPAAPVRLAVVRFAVVLVRLVAACLPVLRFAVVLSAVVRFAVPPLRVAVARFAAVPGRLVVARVPTVRFAVVRFAVVRFAGPRRFAALVAPLPAGRELPAGACPPSRVPRSSSTLPNAAMCCCVFSARSSINA